MKQQWEVLNHWLDQRTGIHTAVRKFLYEEIPASSGWHQVFGSVAVFLILVQAFTGVILAFNYAPTPGDAYNSLRYILTDVTSGPLMRGLHHWGASMLIVVVLLHMLQVFLWGAYKKPREMTWMLGVILLLITLAYGLTGYLLPWDNRAYWGTVVTTRIAAQTPLLGPYLSRMLGGENAIGVVTFARFYSLHTLLLPPITTLLIGFHIYLVRKHGVAPAFGDELLPKKKFYPEQVFKDTIAIFIAFAVLFVMALVVRVPLGQLADPTDANYVPRPEWYFLFLFQMLKLFSGPLEVFGAVILPGLAVLILVLVPFLDRSQMVKVTRRTFAFTFAGLAAIGWAALTAQAVLTTPPEAPSSAIDYSVPTDWLDLRPEELAGIFYFRQESCLSCHSVGDGSSKIGPDLTNTAVRRDAAWMIQHFKNPAALRPGTSMPSIQLNNAQLSALSAFILRLNMANASALNMTPDFAVQGALVYQANRCGTCHMVNGAGAEIGPALNGLRKRRSRSWVEEHFVDPKKLSPGSTMPPAKLPPQDLENLTTYLLTLPDSIGTVP